MYTENLSSDLKGVLERIRGICFRVESIVSQCMDGFMRHKVALIDAAKKVSHAIHDEENELIGLLSKKAAQPNGDEGLIRSMMAVVSHLEMATSGLDGILQHVKIKVDEGVLFSDKGVSEISHIFRETLDVVKATGDAIVTKNEVLKKYVIDKYASLTQTVDAYSEEHEERLIKGICQPKSSSLYLSISDSLVKVVWHMKQAVERFFASR